MTGWLIQIDAWQGPMAFPVRLASHDDERLCHLDGQTWWPAIAKLPTFRYDFFDGAFDAGSITSPSGSFQAAIEAIPALPALAIHDARIRIWSGERGSAFASYMLAFDGRVKEQPTVDAGAMSVSFGVDDGWLDRPLLATYAGTGGAEGGEALKGQVKPLALGAPRFAPATLIDPIDNIYQLSGYGVIAGVETAFERLNRFGAPMGNAASFAALKASSVTRGQWATCLSGGFVRLGAPPEGMLCFHLGGDAVGGWSRLPGALIARVATIGGGAGRYAVDDIAALNTARPWPLSIMVTAQTTARDLIQRIAMSVNAVAYVDWLGQLRVAPLEIGVPSLTIAADGSSLPPVASVEQVAIAAPYWKLSQSAAVTWQVHGLGDIAFSSPLTPRGPYDPAETYREGDMVTLSNGSQWLFIATTPAAGSMPAIGNTDWFCLSDAITASNITYDDGKTVEELKPAEPGATSGAPTGTPIHDRLAEDVANDLDLNAMNWLAEAAMAGSWRSQTDEVIYTSDGTPVRVAVDQIGIMANGHQAFITELKSVSGDGIAKYMMSVNGDGAIVGMRALAGGGVAQLAFMASQFLFVDNAGANPVTALLYEGGVWKMKSIEVDTLKVRSVTTDSLALFAATKPYFTQRPTDIALTNLATVTILSLTINKQEEDSTIDLNASIRIESSDDIRGTFAVLLDGGQVDAVGVYMNGANGTFRITQPLSTFLEDVGIGSHVLTITFFRNGGGSAVVAKAGSNLKATELKR